MVECVDVLRQWVVLFLGTLLDSRPYCHSAAPSRHHGHYSWYLPPRRWSIKWSITRQSIGHCAEVAAGRLFTAPRAACRLGVPSSPATVDPRLLAGDRVGEASGRVGIGVGAAPVVERH